MRWVRSKKLFVIAGLASAACADPQGSVLGNGAGASAGTAGAAATGGSGGSATGGSATGGSATGGSATGGSGGSATGGSGGSATGGSGGSATGGSGGSATGGSAGMGGGGAAGAGGSAGSGGCPSGRGPDMVSIGSACVDSTEVTNAQYAAFLAASLPTDTGQPNVCSWNTSFQPSAGWPATGRDSYPVVYVDWCDAFAFCKWAGKRLCGNLNGGANNFDEYHRAWLSTWYAACTNHGSTAYPYGDTYDGAACNGVDFGAGEALPVKQASGCEGGVAGLFDMSGNVWEWEDSCQSETGDSDQCRLRGGSFWYNGVSDLRCDNPNANDRSASLDIYGFRCCAP